ncbi:prepilin peptidase [Caldicellulosiruptoraceae bacterium PP1]
MFIALGIALITTTIAGYYDYKKNVVPDILWAINLIASIIIFRLELLKNGHLQIALMIFFVMLLVALLLKAFDGGDVKYIPSIALLTGEYIGLTILIGGLIEIVYAYIRSYIKKESIWATKLPTMPFIFIGMLASSGFEIYNIIKLYM